MWKTRGRENLSDLLSEFRSAAEAAYDYRSTPSEKKGATYRVDDLAYHLEHHPDITADSEGGTLTQVRDIARTALAGRNSASELDALDRRLGLDPERVRPSEDTMKASARWFARQDAVNTALPKTENVPVPGYIAERINNLEGKNPLLPKSELRSLDPESLAGIKRQQDAAALSALAEYANEGSDDDDRDGTWVDVPLRRDDTWALSRRQGDADAHAEPAYVESEVRDQDRRWIADSSRAATAADLYREGPERYAEFLSAQKAAGLGEPIETAAARTITGEDPRAFAAAQAASDGEKRSGEGLEQLKGRLRNYPDGYGVFDPDGSRTPDPLTTRKLHSITDTAVERMFDPDLTGMYDFNEPDLARDYLDSEIPGLDKLSADQRSDIFSEVTHQAESANASGELDVDECSDQIAVTVAEFIPPEDPTPGVGEPGYGRVRMNNTHIFRQDDEGQWSSRPKGAEGAWTLFQDPPASAVVVPPSEAAAHMGSRCLACGRTLKNTPASGYGPHCAKKFA